MKRILCIRPGLHARPALLMAVALAAAGCSSGDGASFQTAAPLAQSPTISAIGNQTVAQDSTSTPIQFTVSDPDSDVSTLKVTARAANADLIAQDGIAITGSGASRTLTITPNESAFGSTTITVAVIDAQGATASRPFNVSVTTQAVSFLGFATQAFSADSNAQPSPLTGLSFTQDADDPTSFDSTLN